MAIRRFFCERLSSDPDRIELPPDEARHARRVLRVERGDRVQLFDGAGRIAEAEVESVGPGVVIRVRSQRTVQRPRPWIDIAAAMPKGDRASVMIEKLSELGADRLIPLTTARSVVDPGKGKLKRFDRIALESAKQCGRAWSMTIDGQTDLPSLLADPRQALRLIADPDGVQDLPTGVDVEGGVLVLIGPEGGWTAEELEASKNAGFRPWRLGPHVLRIETAAMAAAAILRDRLGGSVE